nr:MAG TPA: hypothetical protein [Caudoviricetes sp.]
MAGSTGLPWKKDQKFKSVKTKLTLFYSPLLKEPEYFGDVVMKKRENYRALERWNMEKGETILRVKGAIKGDLHIKRADFIKQAQYRLKYRPDKLEHSSLIVPKYFERVATEIFFSDQKPAPKPPLPKFSFVDNVIIFESAPECEIIISYLTDVLVGEIPAGISPQKFALNFRHFDKKIEYIHERATNVSGAIYPCNYKFILSLSEIYNISLDELKGASVKFYNFNEIGELQEKAQIPLSPFGDVSCAAFASFWGEAFSAFHVILENEKELALKVVKFSIKGGVEIEDFEDFINYFRDKLKQEQKDKDAD